VVAIVVTFLVTVWVRLAAQQTGASEPHAELLTDTLQETLTRYCVTCHNQRLLTAGLALDTVDLANVTAHTETLEKVVRRLRTGTMPPQGIPRPDPVIYERTVVSLERLLDAAAAASPNPGRPLPHRLNRAEYANAIRDLLAIDVDVTTLLPRDDSSGGFDNVADALGVSPVLLERYLAAAETISTRAVGEREVGVSSATYRVRQELSQDQHLEGLPLGTVGGMVVRHTFPVEGEYEFQVRLLRTNLDAMRGLVYPRRLEIAVDNERVLLTTVGGTEDLLSLFPANPIEESRATMASDAIDRRLRVRVPVKAGPREVSAAFVQQRPLGTTRLQPFLKSAGNTFDFTGTPHITSLTVTGPYDPGAPGDTPSRRRIFVCQPSRLAAERPCATQILSTLARRAYRRSVSEAEVASLMAFYDVERAAGRTFEDGIRAGLQRLLASPKFVFRVETDPVGVREGEPYPLDDFALASRLSFFLWSSIPDDELLTAASRRRLGQPPELARQVRRMLADPRSRALVENFGGQWLQLRNLQNSVPNSDIFPDFDENLRRAFARETELLFESIIREDRSVLDLLTADYTFVNERLARHYGIPYVSGSEFRRVAVTDERRKGLLGHGSILTLTSHATRTSPVLRGKWILDNLLGTPPPPAPPDVPALKEHDESEALQTVREQLAEHRASPACASCHKIMDPLGFALEHFDAVGTWRSHEAGEPIDASGTLADGTIVDGAIALRRALLSRPTVIVGTMVERLLTYAIGRGLDERDMPSVRAIVRGAGADRYRFSAVVLGIVNSAPFRMRTAGAATEVRATSASRRDPHRRTVDP
jgi:hypothetical protein